MGFLRGRSDGYIATRCTRTSRALREKELIEESAGEHISKILRPEHEREVP